MSLVDTREGATAWARRTAASSRRQDRRIEAPQFLTTAHLDGEISPEKGDVAELASERFLEPGGSLIVLLVATHSTPRTHFRELIAKGGYRVITASSGKEAIRLLERETFALTVIHEVDDFPPSKLSREIKMQVRQELRAEIPVVLIASTFDPDYAVRCLRAGSDDYISGPHLEQRVLLARLEAVLRSYRRRSDEVRREPKAAIVVGDLMLDPVRFRIEVSGKPVDLTRIQFSILYAMACRPGRIFSRSQLRGVIAEHGGNPDDNSIKSHVCHLRQRLGRAGRQIETVRGMGYRLLE